MLYYIDNNAQLTFYSLLSCNVTIQHYEKHVRTGKIVFSYSVFFFFVVFIFFFCPFVFIFFLIYFFFSFGGKARYTYILFRENTLDETLQI